MSKYLGLKGDDRRPVQTSCSNSPGVLRWTCPSCFTDFEDGASGKIDRCSECGALVRMSVETALISHADLIDEEDAAVYVDEIAAAGFEALLEE